MVARGKAVRSAVSSGHHEITKDMRKTRSIGQDIERWWKVNEVQIPGTKDALYRASLDSLNLLSPSYPLEVICRAYKWRWQVELLFKEWKSYANLHAFDTANPTLVEGLIWAAIAAAALKRFLAHMPQLLVKVPMSTRKVAMCAVHVLGGIVQALKTGDVAGLYDALEEAVTYLACHAQRAHPKRDRQTGRAQLGLEPCFEHDDVIEFAEAA